MPEIITTASTALPRDIDVRVNVSKVAAEMTTDLSVMCFVGATGFPNSFSHDASRVRFYSTLAAVMDDFSVSSEPYKAAVAFFSQSPRAKTMAIGRIFTTAQAGFLQCGRLASKTLAEWRAITNGSFAITIDNVTCTISGVSFASIAKEEDIASVVQTAIQAVTGVTTGYVVSGLSDPDFEGEFTADDVGMVNSSNNYLYVLQTAEGYEWNIGTTEQYASRTRGKYYTFPFTSASPSNIASTTWRQQGSMDTIPMVTATAQTSEGQTDIAGFSGATVLYDSGALRIVSGTAGNSSSVGYLVAASSGTDLSVPLNGAYIEGAEAQPAYVVPGYDPNEATEGGTEWNFKAELGCVQQAASASGRFIYAWAIEKAYRDSDIQLQLAEWMEAQTYGMAGITLNSSAAKDAAANLDIGSLLKAAGYRRSFAVYHNNPYYYPEVAIMSYALSVNYAAQDSTITTKFKSLQGIPTVPVTESELAVLVSKRINTYTLVGNSSKTFREGVASDDAWYIDDLVNLDNFREELQAEVYNVFLRNKKVPYNVKGVTLLYAAMDKVCARYVYNGTFTERPLTEAEKIETGLEFAPAYEIEITPIESMTIADRANRVGPPAVIKVNLAGAIHSIDISVEAYS